MGGRIEQLLSVTTIVAEQSAPLPFPEVKVGPVTCAGYVGRQGSCGLLASASHWQCWRIIF